jgi:hypothetical protein
MVSKFLSREGSGNKSGKPSTDGREVASFTLTLVHPVGISKSAWQKQRRGANGFNRTITCDWWRAAYQAGIEWVRLAPDKWGKAAGSWDFLIGNADSFTGLDTIDIRRLIRCLDSAALEKVSVVLTLLSLPGALASA